MLIQPKVFRKMVVVYYGNQLNTVKNSWNLTCSSSGGSAKTAFGILRVYVRWLWHGARATAN
jgi:hypothetical protein